MKYTCDFFDAPEHSLSYDNELDCHLYTSIQDYAHPKILALSKQISRKYYVRQHEDYEKYTRQYEKQIQQHGEIIDADLDRHALTEVNIET